MFTRTLTFFAAALIAGAADNGKLELLFQLPGPSAGPRQFAFSTAREGWAWEAGTSALWSTADGGRSWKPVIWPGKDTITWVFVGSAETAHVWSSSSKMFRTDDLGRHWIPVGLPPNEVNPQTYFSGDIGWASIGRDFQALIDESGYSGYRRHEIWGTKDGGKSWIRQWEGPTKPGRPERMSMIGEFRFVDSKHGFALSDGQLLITHDGGANWFDADLPDKAGNIEQAFLIDSDHGWLLDVNGVLLRTVDGGKTWSRLPGTGQRWRVRQGIQAPQLWFATATHGWLIANDGSLWKSVDGGTNWQSMNRGNMAYLNCGLVSDLQHRVYRLKP